LAPIELRLQTPLAGWSEAQSGTAFPDYSASRRLIQATMTSREAVLRAEFSRISVPI
jgi:hypothetical protein